MDLLIIATDHNHTNEEIQVKQSVDGYFIGNNAQENIFFNLGNRCISFQLCHKSTDKGRIWNFDLSS